MSKNSVLRLNTMAEFEALKNRNKKIPPGLSHDEWLAAYQKQNKFHAKITEAEGIKFGSKKEAQQFRELQARQHAGEIKFFLLQVPFLLPGVADNGKRTRHYLDFMAIRTDGQIEYIEVKGRDLPMGKLKRRQTEELYGIKIQVV
ncbi:MAG: hypothetical protein CVU62_13300 [Deltaproteobacteria bacterium HGW-Deltaproteobacteria-2]|nr:MAG: hypothetical protein CVU62_13300 [Deltaproteobacteria bacterium HGW-Deltaproteobacteria-2]